MTPRLRESKPRTPAAQEEMGDEIREYSLSLGAELYGVASAAERSSADPLTRG